MDRISMNRRGMMVMAGMAPLLASVPALAQGTGSAPSQGRAETIRLGGFEVSTLLGGQSMRPNPIETFGIGADPAAFEAVSTANFLPSDRGGSSYTMTLVRTPRPCCCLMPVWLRRTAWPRWRRRDTSRRM